MYIHTILPQRSLNKSHVDSLLFFFLAHKATASVIGYSSQYVTMHQEFFSDACFDQF